MLWRLRYSYSRTLGHRFVKNRTTASTINANTTNSRIVFNVVVMGVSPLTESPREVRLRGWFLTIVMIKLAKQVFLCANGITRIGGRSKELSFALLAACHSGNLALISQDDEVAICHEADSLSQFQGLFHYKELLEGTMWRERALKIALVVVGLIFCGLAYPMIMFVKQAPALAMSFSVYVTLGIFLLLASRNPTANRSLIAFTAWSSFVHAMLMAGQAFARLIARGELIGSAVLLVIGIALIVWAPEKTPVSISRS